MSHLHTPRKGKKWCESRLIASARALSTQEQHGGCEIIPLFGRRVKRLQNEAAKRDLNVSLPAPVVLDLFPQLTSITSAQSAQTRFSSVFRYDTSPPCDTYTCGGVFRSAHTGCYDKQMHTRFSLCSCPFSRFWAFGNIQIGQADRRTASTADPIFAFNASAAQRSAHCALQGASDAVMHHGTEATMEVPDRVGAFEGTPKDPPEAPPEAPSDADRRSCTGQCCSTSFLQALKRTRKRVLHSAKQAAKQRSGGEDLSLSQHQRAMLDCAVRIIIGGSPHAFQTH